MKKIWKKITAHPELIERILFFLILAIGIAVRFWNISSNPAGINQDEASDGYDAWSLLNYGIDRNGYHNPVHFISWGAGKSVLYGYLSIPFIKLLSLSSLSIRMVNALLSVAVLIGFYFILRKLINNKAGLIGLFLLAINPWHIMSSRWGFQTSLFPTIVFFGVCFYLFSKKIKYFTFFPPFFFGLSLYTYTPSYFFIPLFYVILCYWAFRTKYVNKKTILFGGIIFILVSFPTLLFLIVNTLKLPSINLFFISIPRVISTGRFSDIFILFQGNPLIKIVKNIYDFLSFLFMKQSDGLIWNSIPEYGYGYMFSAPFLLAGIILLYRNYRKYFIWALWLTISILLACITVFNMNRLSILFLPLIFCTTLAVSSIFQKYKLLFWAIIFIYFISFMSFAKFYFFQYPSYIGPTFFATLGDAIQTASSSSKSETIIVTDKVNMPQIYVLFYEKISPVLYLKTVKFKNPGAQFQQVSSFGRYGFGIDPKKIDRNKTYVFKNYEEEYFNSGFRVTRYEYYSVAQGL